MAGFIDYLDNFEKKFEKRIVDEQSKKVIEQKVVKENVVIPKRVIKIIKKAAVQTKPIHEHINHAANILNGIENCGGNSMMPSSARYYDNTGLSSKKNINKEVSKNITSMANDLLSEDNSSGGMPMPLMNIPQLDDEMMKFVPSEMLSESERQQLQSSQLKIDKSKIEISPETQQKLQQMEEQTKQLQQMTTNVDFSDIPLEFLPR